MSDVAYQIDFNLLEKLQDKAYREEFFRAEASSLIAKQLISLRKKRDLSQKEVAELTGTQQPAISRAERADYENWNLSNLRKITDVLDARLRVIIEPAEDVLSEYAEPAQETDVASADAAESMEIAGTTLTPWTTIFDITPPGRPLEFVLWPGTNLNSSLAGTGFSVIQMPFANLATPLAPPTQPVAVKPPVQTVSAKANDRLGSLERSLLDLMKRCHDLETENAELRRASEDVAPFDPADQNVGKFGSVNRRGRTFQFQNSPQGQPQ